MNYNSVKFFLDKFITQIFGLNEIDWVVTTLGSGRYNDEWYWKIYLKNNKTKEEKIIRIPCYKD